MSVNFSVMKVTIERLEQVLRERNVSKSDFMTHFHLVKQGWQHWRERGIPANKTIPICEYLEISLEELTGKKSKKTQSHAPSSQKEDRQDLHADIDALPAEFIGDARHFIRYVKNLAERSSSSSQLKSSKKRS